MTTSTKVGWLKGVNATLMENVPANQRIRTEGAFGPAAVLSRFKQFDEALAEVNDSTFGLQAWDGETEPTAQQNDSFHHPTPSLYLHATFTVAKKKR